MKSYIFYSSTGFITQVGYCDDASFAIQSPPSGFTILEISSNPDNAFDYMKLNYVHNGAVVARQSISPTVSKTQITSDGIDSTTISGLPDPCTVSISGPVSVAPTSVTGGSITITCNAPGAITVSVEADPTYVSWSTTINAV